MKNSNGKRSPAPVAAETPVLLVYGFDEANKARAAAFSGVDADQVAKAAKAMDLQVHEATSASLQEVAKKLPVGKLYANGRGFVPNIRPALYRKLHDALVELTMSPAEYEKTTPAVASGVPRTWDDIAPGHLVIAQETREYGWWEAIVLDRHGDRVTLKFRDYPHLPRCVRHLAAIALLNPDLH